MNHSDAAPLAEGYAGNGRKSALLAEKCPRLESHNFHYHVSACRFCLMRYGSRTVQTLNEQFVTQLHVGVQA